MSLEEIEYEVWDSIAEPYIAFSSQFPLSKGGSRFTIKYITSVMDCGPRKNQLLTISLIKSFSWRRSARRTTVFSRTGQIPWSKIGSRPNRLRFSLVRGCRWNRKDDKRFRWQEEKKWQEELNWQEKIRLPRHWPCYLIAFATYLSGNIGVSTTGSKTRALVFFVSLVGVNKELSGICGLW